MKTLKEHFLPLFPLLYCTLTYFVGWICAKTMSEDHKFLFVYLYVHGVVVIAVIIWGNMAAKLTDLIYPAEQSSIRKPQFNNFRIKRRNVK